MKKVIIFLLLIQILVGADMDDGGRIHPIQRFGIGARATGMGKAYVALSDDIASLYYNPAGMSSIDRQEFSFMRILPFPSESFDFLGYIYPLGKHRVGLGVTKLDVSDISGRNEFGRETNTFNARQTNMTLAYSLRYQYGIFFGANVNLFYTSIAQYNDIGIGIDLSGKYIFQDKKKDHILKFYESSKEQLLDITWTKYDNIKKLYKDNQLTEIQKLIIDLVQVNPEFRKTAEILRNTLKLLKKDNIKSEVELVFEKNDLYKGLRANIRNILTDKKMLESHLMSTIDKYYQKGFGYYNHGELYAALKCWKLCLNLMEKEKLKNHLSAGIKIENILQPNIRLLNESEKLPVNLKLGAAYKLLYDKLVISADLNMYFGEHLSPQIGIEYNLINKLKLRVGWDRTFHVNDGITFGLGFELYNFKLDYAYELNTNIADFHNFSVTFNFGESMEEKSRALYQLGLLSYHREEYVDAVAMFKKCLNINPGFVIAQREIKVVEEKLYNARKGIDKMFQTGMREYNRRNFSDARKIFQSILNIDPNYVQAKSKLMEIEQKVTLMTRGNIILAEQMYDNKKYTKAIQYWERALQVDPSNISIQAAIESSRAKIAKIVKTNFDDAEDLIEDKEYKEARKKLEEILKIEPDNQLVTQRLNWLKEKIYSMEGDKYKSLMANRLFNSGKQMYAKKDYISAMIDLNQSLTLEPDNEDAQNLLNDVLKKYKKNVDEQYQKAVEIYNTGDYKKSAELFQVVLTVNPNHKGAKDYLILSKSKWEENIEKLYQDGMVYMESEDFKKALEIFNEVMELAGPYKNVKYLQLKAKDLLAQQIAAVQEEEKIEEAARIHSEGVLLYDSGKLKEAKKKFLAAVKLNPNLLKSFFNIALCDEKLGNDESAKIYYKKTLTIDPEFYLARMNLALLYFRNGDRMRAEKEAQKVIRLSKEQGDKAIQEKASEFLKILKGL